MNGAQLLFLLIVFVVVAGLVALAMLAFSPVPLHQRLRIFMGPAGDAAPQPGGWVERVAKVAQPFSRLSLPEDGWEKSALRTRFMNAGWRNPAAATVYFAAKTVLALLAPALLALTMA